MAIAQDCAHVLKNMFPQNFVNINDMISFFFDSDYVHRLLKKKLLKKFTCEVTSSSIDV